MTLIALDYNSPFTECYGELSAGFANRMHLGAVSFRQQLAEHEKVPQTLLQIRISLRVSKTSVPKSHSIPVKSSRVRAASVVGRRSPGGTMCSKFETWALLGGNLLLSLTLMFPLSF